MKASVMEKKEERQSKLLSIIKQISPNTGVLTFTNSQNHSHFSENMEVYYNDLSEIGYRFEKQKESPEEVVLVYFPANGGQKNA